MATFTVSSGGSYASGAGNVPTSGATVFSGPWMEETQNLTITYARVPGGGVSATDITLSSAQASATVTHTYVLMKVDAYYRKQKTWNNYSSSSYTQTQKFNFKVESGDTSNTSAVDYLGNNYGALTASTIGAAGTIVSYQPWYYRRAWEQGDNNTEVTRKVTGYNFAAGHLDCGAGTWQGVTYTDLKPFSDYESVFIDPDKRGSLIPYGSDFVVLTNQHYWKPGAYTTDQESLFNIISLINFSAGSNVTMVRLYDSPSEFHPQNGTAIPSIGFSEYDINRHDFS